MRWDRFFEDLEDQLDSEWEAERAALDSEAERLRLSRVVLRERLVAVHTRSIGVDLLSGEALRGTVAAVGADWFALDPDAGSAGSIIVPLDAVLALGLAGPDVVASARDASGGTALSQRMTLGFVLRDLARRRVPVTARLRTGRSLRGTIDRAGADHLDLALHERGRTRRDADVAGFRLIPISALAAVALDEATTLP